MMKRRKVQKDTKLWTNVMAKVRREHPKWGYKRRRDAAYALRNKK